MPFVPHGKKAKRSKGSLPVGGQVSPPEHEEVAKWIVARLTGALPGTLLDDDQREAVLDFAIAGARQAVVGQGLCLPMSVLVERLLADLLPESRFSLKLGSLRVYPAGSNQAAIFFDPRTSTGIDGGFHSWLEATDGTLVDPSIFVTLDHHGYAVNPASYPLMKGRCFDWAGLRFLYEELQELELLGVAESETHLARLKALAMLGRPLVTSGYIALDVGWRKHP